MASWLIFYVQYCSSIVSLLMGELSVLITLLATLPKWLFKSSGEIPLVVLVVASDSAVDALVWSATPVAVSDDVAEVVVATVWVVAAAVAVYCCVDTGTGHSLLLCRHRNWSQFTVVSTQELVTVYCCVHSGTGHSLLLCRYRNWSQFTGPLRNWSQFTVVSTQEQVTVYCCVDTGIGHSLLLCPLRNWSTFTVVSTQELVTVHCCVHSGTGQFTVVSTQELVTVYCCVDTETGHSLLLCPLRNRSQFTVVSTQELVSSSLLCRLRNWSVYCCVHSGTGQFTVVSSQELVTSTQELVSLLLCRLRNWSQRLRNWSVYCCIHSGTGQFTVVSTQELVTVHCCVHSGTGHSSLLCPLRNWSQFTVVSTQELVTVHCCVHSGTGHSSLLCRHRNWSVYSCLDTGTGHSLLLCPLRIVPVHLCAGCEPDATNATASLRQDRHLTVRCSFRLHTGYSFRLLYIDSLNKDYTWSHVVAAFYLFHGRISKYWGVHVSPAKREFLEGSLEDGYFAVRFRNTDCSDDGKSYKCTVQGISPGPVAFSADVVITVSLKGC